MVIKNDSIEGGMNPGVSGCGWMESKMIGDSYRQDIEIPRDYKITV